MKFSKEVVIPEAPENGLPTEIQGDEEEIEMFLKFAMLTTDVDSILRRIKDFSGDSTFLKQLKDILRQMKGNVSQVSLDFTNRHRRGGSQDSIDENESNDIQNRERRRKLQSSKDSVESQSQADKLKQAKESIVNKLRQLKNQDPNRFGQLLNKSVNIKMSNDNFLSAVQYTGIDQTRKPSKIFTSQTFKKLTRQSEQ